MTKADVPGDGTPKRGARKVSTNSFEGEISKK